jgi:hypothetical protein
MKTLLLAFGVSVALVAPALARDYSAVGAFDDSVEYLDPSTVKTDGDVKTFWTNVVYIRTNNLGIDWTSQHESVDCANDRMITLNVIGYRMNGEVVGQTQGYAHIQPRWIDIPPETEASAVENAVCHGNVLGTDSGASFLEIVPIIRRRLIQIAAEHPQPGRPMQQTSTPPPDDSSSGPDPGQPAYSSSDPGTDQPVYSASECVGTIVAGVCHGAILPNQATHPICHGEMLNGTCTGPMF